MSPRRVALCAKCGKKVYAEQDLITGREQLIRWAQERGIALKQPNMPDLHLGCAGALRRELAEQTMLPRLDAIEALACALRIP